MQAIFCKIHLLNWKKNGNITVKHENGRGTVGVFHLKFTFRKTRMKCITVPHRLNELSIGSKQLCSALASDFITGFYLFLHVTDAVFDEPKNKKLWVVF